MRNKADFKPLRETVGMSQDMLATLMGVTIRSIRRWESASEPHQPPQEAWDILEAARERQIEAVDYAVEQAESHGQDTDSFDLTYWPSAKTFREAHPDGTLDSYTMANATTRLIAHELEMLGFEVTFGFGWLTSLGMTSRDRRKGDVRP